MHCDDWGQLCVPLELSAEEVHPKSRSVLLTDPTLQLRWKSLFDRLLDVKPLVAQGLRGFRGNLQFLIVPLSGIPW